MLQRQTHFTFIVGTASASNNQYTCSIPNPGQLIQIESQKAILSGGMYSAILDSDTYGGTYALDIIDMHSYFSILMPALINDIKADSLITMDLFDFNELRQAYRHQFIPWVNSWMNMLAAPPEKLIVADKEPVATAPALPELPTTTPLEVQQPVVQTIVAPTVAVAPEPAPENHTTPNPLDDDISEDDLPPVQTRYTEALAVDATLDATEPTQ